MKPKKLPNGITSDEQLRKWGREYIPGFIDVIDRTQFKSKYKSMRPGDSIIVNLDPGYKHGGTHWVAVRISSEAPIVYYKDSFGAPPPNDISGAIRDRGLIYGNRVYQKLREENCGKRAAYFLYNMNAAAGEKKEIEYFESREI